MTINNKPVPVDHFVEKIDLMKDVEEEAHQRGMKNIDIWPDHILIELQSKTVKVWYDGRIEQVDI